MSLTSYRAAPPRANVVLSATDLDEVRKADRPPRLIGAEAKAADAAAGA